MALAAVLLIAALGLPGGSCSLSEKLAGEWGSVLIEPETRPETMLVRESFLLGSLGKGCWLARKAMLEVFRPWIENGTAPDRTACCPMSHLDFIWSHFSPHREFRSNLTVCAVGAELGFGLNLLPFMCGPANATVHLLSQGPEPSGFAAARLAALNQAHLVHWEVAKRPPEEVPVLHAFAGTPSRCDVVYAETPADLQAHLPALERLASASEEEDVYLIAHQCESLASASRELREAVEELDSAQLKQHRFYQLEIPEAWREVFDGCGRRNLCVGRFRAARRPAATPPAPAHPQHAIGIVALPPSLRGPARDPFPLVVSASRGPFSRCRQALARMAHRFEEWMPLWSMEGGSLPSQFLYLAEVASRLNPRTVCQTGLNTGLGALAFLCGSPKAVVHSYDLGPVLGHRYVRNVSGYLQRAYPGRFFSTFGDSIKVLSEVSHGRRGGPGPRCDVSFVDGGHVGQPPYYDLHNFAILSTQPSGTGVAGGVEPGFAGPLLIMDDCSVKGDNAAWYTQDPIQAYSVAMRDGVVQDYTFRAWELGLPSVTALRLDQTYFHEGYHKDYCIGRIMPRENWLTTGFKRAKRFFDSDHYLFDGEEDWVRGAGSPRHMWGSEP